MEKSPVQRSGAKSQLKADACGGRTMKSQSTLPLASTMSPAMSNKQEESIARKDTRMHRLLPLPLCRTGI